MMSGLLRIALTGVMLFGFSASPIAAEMTAEQKQEIETVIREYLLANPELLEEAIEVLRARREEEAAVAQAKAIERSHALIFDSPNQSVVGNPDGSVTLVEFFDYNCGYCRRALDDMNALLAANPDLRMVMKEFPILSEGSVEAARISVAVHKLAPESYLDFHNELFVRPGEATEEKALEVARDLGLDVEALKTAAQGEDVMLNLQEVQELATTLGISGTPSYVIGTELVPGAIGYDGLQERVTALREAAPQSAEPERMRLDPEPR
jgi:protein-disulfide isomerase